MKTLNPLLLMTVLTFLSVNFTAAQSCPGTNLVENPVDFIWTYHPVSANNPEAYFSGVMEVGQATFAINGQTLTTRAYRQQGGDYSIPGPTITVAPGNKYVLSFHNTLPYQPLSSVENEFKDPNVSNIHTHGLHISPMSPGDDVTRSFEGGRGGDFVWDIPSNHMGGTYWYHAHHHGSSFLQVSAGLFGMLIVDDSNDGIPANVAAMAERELILAYLNPGVAGTGGDVLVSGTLTPGWTVNGKVLGNICMPPNTWQHWRVLLADGDARMKTIEFGAGSEVKLLARDGVWRTVAPGSLTQNKIDLTGASRADFAIRTASTSWIKVGGTTVANIYTQGTSDPGPNPYNTNGVSTWSATRPTYLRDLRNENNVNNQTVSMGARTINGNKFNHHVPTFSLPADKVQNWSISGATQHPFHIHVYHVQAQQSLNGFEVGEYYDVVAAGMNVRFDLNEATSSVYEGMTILHCHVLDHEDRGAMGWIDVIGGEVPPTFPANTPYSEYYVLSGGTPAAPTSLFATATSSSSINLSWTDNSGNENGFTIQRSTDATNFNTIASVGANVVTYTSNGLNASTTYYYRVIAYNAAGNSANSNVANATTQSAGGTVVMHVHNITVVRQALGGNRFKGVATIEIRDGNNVPVSGATVVGDFTGPSSLAATGTTNTNGLVTLSTGSVKNPVGEWCFTVTNVSKSGATYNSGANIVTNRCESDPIIPLIMKRTTKLEVSPNPLQNPTYIAFELEEEAIVSIEVYTVTGKRVAVLADGIYKAGHHILEWDTNALANGYYLLPFRVGTRLVQTSKLVMIR
jgi:suppressor of ftsI